VLARLKNNSVAHFPFHLTTEYNDTAHRFICVLSILMTPTLKATLSKLTLISVNLEEFN